ncbi:unknown [Haloarcula marismortui ATCC 43049]|uniref:CAP domain-containing protein n=1 Tax=Haloarcula marismortui (strain ATCC 43049 / DSM 3752 / JCM 8966 / VKM B-1809) TaxID=272569 RepID=Q5V5S8_HALMA|nr:CAP domain-containing protein [Haloarcula marismortui]AAV45124.1 unknown [Haloarcula marismortui ATCC 43049]QCP92910.1 CAP domain-containing protein [Haloarcula marismortui ATCC 43049]
MVKKGLLAIAAVVLLVVLGTGVLVGAQFAGGTADTTTQTTDSQSGDGGGNDDSSTATATAGNSTTPTPTAETNGTATPQQESIPAREFNEQNVSDYVRQFLNEEREAAGVPPFESGLRTEEGLNEMAKSHSEQMAIEGKAIHKIDGVSSKDRYEDTGLYDRCTFESAEGEYIEQPDRNRFEAVEKTVAGQPYEEGGEERFHATDKEVARKIVDDWMAWPDYRERLTLRNANIVGIGVEITDTGNVYATANICG